MGLGRLSQGDKRPARGIPFNIDLIRKEVCKSVDTDTVPVVQYIEQENDCQ